MENKRHDSKIDETPGEFLDESIIPEGKWRRDRFGEEHYTSGSLDQGKIELGRKRESRKGRVK